MCCISGLFNREFCRQQAGGISRSIMPLPMPMSDARRMPALLTGSPSIPRTADEAQPGIRHLRGRHHDEEICGCLPLARQEKIWAQEGVQLSRAIMANWVFQCIQGLSLCIGTYVAILRQVSIPRTPGKLDVLGTRSTTALQRET